MQIYNITEAKANLSKILADIELNKQSVILARNNHFIAELVPYKGHEHPKKTLGFYKRDIKIAEDFDTLPDDIAEAFGLIDKQEE